MHSILIADDHEIVRLGLRLLTTEALGNCEINFATDANSLIQQIRTHSYDLLISDINMPGMEGITTFETLLRIRPALKILVFSVNPENIHGKRLLTTGVYGYVEKDSSNDIIKKAIQSIVTGKKYFSYDLLLASSQSRPENSDNKFELLSDRELELVMLLLKGKAVGEAADSLHMHISTASTHKVRAFKKLGVENIRELIDLATLHRLI